MRLWVKVSIAIILITWSALGLTSFINYVKYRASFTQTFNSRFAVVADDLRQTIENGLTLGIPLSELSNVQDILVRSAQGPDHILSIDTLDTAGWVVWSSNRERIGSQRPVAWLAFDKGSIDALRSGENDQIFFTGMILSNNIGTAAGAVVVDYSKSYAIAHLEEVIRQLVLYTSAIFLLSALSIFMIVRLMVHHLGHKFEQMGSALLRLIESPQSGPLQQNDDAIQNDPHFHDFYKNIQNRLLTSESASDRETR